MTDYVMVWDCDYCSNKGIRGYIYECPGGHPRSKGVVFYDPPTPILATAAQMKLMGGRDPNWYCLHCNCGNLQKNDECWKCGAPRGSSPDNAQRVYGAGQERYSTADKAELESTVAPVVRNRRPEKVDEYNPSSSYSNGDTMSSQYTSRSYESFEYNGGLLDRFKNFMTPRNIKISAGVVLSSLALIFAIWFFFFNTHQVMATVTGFSWEQSAAIEEYQTLHKEGWSVPYGGRPTAQETRQNGTDRIHDGWDTVSYTDTCYKSVYHSRTCYQDNGNGSKSSYECGSSSPEPYSCQKTRQEERYHIVPHYDTWYWYDIDEWVEITRKKTSGENHVPVFDPISPQGDLQRRKEYLGTYTVYFSSEDPGSFSKTYDLPTWSLFGIERSYVIMVNPVHKIIEYPNPVITP